MKNILVPIDGSQPSRNALQHAIDIANAYSAELTIVNITNADAVLDSFDVFEDMTDEKVKDLTKLAKDKSGYVLEKAMDAVPENLMVHTVQLVSTPEIGILSEADKCNADLIVMGRRGSHSLSEQLLGSASTYVLAHAKCPVLLAHNEKEGPYQRILVPADGSEESLKAVRYAVEFAKADGASVTIFHVANMRDLIAEETALDQKKRGLEDLTDRLRQSADRVFALCKAAIADQKTASTSTSSPTSAVRARQSSKKPKKTARTCSSWAAAAAAAWPRSSWAASAATSRPIRACPS